MDGSFNLSEWQLEPVVVMATMQCDMWRGKQDTYSHMLLFSAKMERRGLLWNKYLHREMQFAQLYR